MLSISLEVVKKIQTQTKKQKEDLFYKSTNYIEWRNAVLKRDGYRCRHCNRKNVRLQADHILPKSTHPELAYVVENGRTLCVRCHKKTPTYGKEALRYRK